MARPALPGLFALAAMLMSMGCNGGGRQNGFAGRPWLTAAGQWTARDDGGQVHVQVNIDSAGLFGNPIAISNGPAQVRVGPLAAQMLDGQPLKLQPARMSRTLSMQRKTLELSQEMQEGQQLRTKIIPGLITLIDVAGADRLTRLTLPIQIDGVELLAMDYGWLMKKPGRFARDRVMTNFVLAEGANQAVLLGADQSWRFEVDPAGRIAAIALHRAATVRFFVGVAGRGHWGRLVHAYRKTAHPDWDAPMDPAQRQRLMSLVGRMVVDDWSGLPYDQMPEVLKRLQFLGCDQLVVVRHNWQHFGYDVKLPDTWPPARNFGGLPAMARLAQYCRRDGMLFGLHENFIDLYRDAPTFSEWSVAYHPKEWHADGRPRPFKGWFNASTGQQAVRHTPGSALLAMQRNLEREQPLRPTTVFMDVTSYVDPEPCETEAGLYIGAEQVLRAGRDLYLQAAEKVHGPTLGEGCTEKFLGAVDGANCDLWGVDRWGNKAAPADWEYFPLLDWLAHDRVVFQGVGYPARYGVPAQVEFAAPMYARPFLENYNCTNVLFGHAPLYFVISTGFAADPINMASQYWLGVPLHEAIGLQRIEDVSFPNGDIHRLHVRYARDARVWVNRSDVPWQVEGATLGRYGYLVRGGGIDQQLTIESGRPFEVARSSDALYLDFRGHRRAYEGIEADGQVLIRYLRGGIEVIPLADNRQPIRVDLEKLGIAAPHQTIKAERLDLDGKQFPVEIDGTTIVVPPQRDANPDSLIEVYKRPLHKVVVRVGP
jgi:hypothetical protein